MLHSGRLLFVKNTSSLFVQIATRHYRLISYRVRHFRLVQWLRVGHMEGAPLSSQSLNYISEKGLPIRTLQLICSDCYLTLQTNKLPCMSSERLFSLV